MQCTVTSLTADEWQQRKPLRVLCLQCGKQLAVLKVIPDPCCVYQSNVFKLLPGQISLQHGDERGDTGAGGHQTQIPARCLDARERQGAFRLLLHPDSVARNRP